MKSKKKLFTKMEKVKTSEMWEIFSLSIVLKENLLLLYYILQYWKQVNFVEILFYIFKK